MLLSSSITSRLVLFLYKNNTLIRQNKKGGLHMSYMYSVSNDMLFVIIGKHIVIRIPSFMLKYARSVFYIDSIQHLK